MTTTGTTPWTPYDAELRATMIFPHPDIETNPRALVAWERLRGKQEGYLRGLADARAEVAPLLEVAKDASDVLHLHLCVWRQLNGTHAILCQRLTDAITRAEKGGPAA